MNPLRTKHKKSQGPDKSETDKYSIKNILFTKTTPSYVPNVSGNIDDYETFNCRDCGDKYLFQSTLQTHLSRKSLKITFFCRHCKLSHIFLNKCNLLSHIRSHVFKTASINVSDLQVEPLPLNEYDIPVVIDEESTTQIVRCPTVKPPAPKTAKLQCFDCKLNVTIPGLTIPEMRAKHYMQKSKTLFKCSVCLLVLHTICALRAHLRIHLKKPPCYCTECGKYLPSHSIFYPFNHDCEGFRIMRATARVRCPIDSQVMHPTEYSQHIKTHILTLYKCPLCTIAYYEENTTKDHMSTTHGLTNKACIIYYQCVPCGKSILLANQLDSHIENHQHENVYPCWKCCSVFKSPSVLIEHFNSCNDGQTLGISKMKSIQNEAAGCRVTKRCDKCKNSFTYKCKYNEIDSLPGLCPFGCKHDNRTNNEQVNEGANDMVNEGANDAASEMANEVALTNSVDTALVTCNLCSNKMPIDWDKIKIHFSEAHTQYRCLDVKVVVGKTDISQYMKTTDSSAVKRPNPGNETEALDNKRKCPDSSESTTMDKSKTGSFSCGKCGEAYDSKEKLEEHLRIHRDPCTAYQCLECGECYVVKPSFSKHLILEHQINDVEEYIKTKSCFNEEALQRYQSTPVTDSNESLRENQCSICRNQFNNHDDLEKHFRVHGMAFLMKNTQKRSP